MIFDRLGVLRALFPSLEQARATSNRWRSAADRQPGLVEDLIRLGGILVLQPIDNGSVDIKDPLRLAYEAGRRDIAVQLLAMMAMTPLTLKTLMEDNET